MNESLRSDCPINFAVELLGDKWSLIIVRDMLLDGKSTYGEFMTSDEGIATNILTSRLVSLEQTGLIEKHTNPLHKRKAIYVLSQKGLDLVPLFIEIMLWSAKYHVTTHEREELLALIRTDRQAGVDLLRDRYTQRLDLNKSYIG